MKPGGNDDAMMHVICNSEVEEYSETDENNNMPQQTFNCDDTLENTKELLITWSWNMIVPWLKSDEKISKEQMSDKQEF